MFVLGGVTIQSYVNILYRATVSNYAIGKYGL